MTATPPATCVYGPLHTHPGAARVTADVIAAHPGWTLVHTVHTPPRRPSDPNYGPVGTLELHSTQRLNLGPDAAQRLAMFIHPDLSAALALTELIGPHGIEDYQALDDTLTAWLLADLLAPNT